MFDAAGPNSQVYLNNTHAMIGYIFQLYQNDTQSWSFGVSAEKPEASATAALASFDSYSHIPDFAARLRFVDNSWGHAQLSGLLRDIAVQSGDDTLRRDAVGWGVHFATAAYPFKDCALFKNDYVSFSGLGGQGIGNYI